MWGFVVNASETIINFVSGLGVKYFVVLPALVLVIGLWITYRFLIAKSLKKNRNATILREVEKHIRDLGGINKLSDILCRTPNDVATVFYALSRSNISADIASRYLNYKDYKKINWKIKPPKLDIPVAGLFIVYAIFVYADFMLTKGAIVSGLIFTLTLTVPFIPLFMAITLITGHRTGACWREFKNLFASIQVNSIVYFRKNHESYQEFCTAILENVTPNKFRTGRVERLIGHLGKQTQSELFKRSYDSGKAYAKPDMIKETSVPQPPQQQENTDSLAKIIEKIVEMKMPQPHSDCNGCSTKDNSSTAVISQMMHMMQQNMTQSQMMQQNAMQKTQMMQQNLHHQSQMMQQNMHQQKQMIHYGNIIENITSNKRLPSSPNVPNITTPQFPAIPPRTATFGRPPQLQQLQPVIPSPVISPVRQQISQEVVDIPAPIVETTVNKPITPQGDVKAPLTTAQTLKPLKITAFKVLNDYFKEKNKDIYASNLGAPVGAVFFPEPKRELTKLEKRLEKILHAKTYLYTEEDWASFRESA